MISIQLVKTITDDTSVTPPILAIKHELAVAKQQIDVFHQHDPEKEEYYRRVTSVLDPFKAFMRYQKEKTPLPKTMTNAWLKCWELIHEYQLIPRDHSLEWTVFCNAELPGAFIFAIDHYIQTKTKSPRYTWFANSLFPTHGDILGDEFGLYKRHRDHWLMDESNGGSVTDLAMIHIIKDRLEGKVDLYTSDIGIGLTQDTFNQQEELEAPLHLGQVICALNTLKEGGHMVCKMFMFFHPFSMSLLYLLMDVFEELYISKPTTSRPGNSEVYLVGKGYHANQALTTRLESVLATWNQESVHHYLTPLPSSFYDQLVSASEHIYKRQMTYIQTILKHVTHLYHTKCESHFKAIQSRLPTVIRDGHRLTNEWYQRYSIPLLKKTL
jgi:cap2 methyltransferase